MKKKIHPVKFLVQNLKILIIIVIILIVFHKYVVRILLCLVLGFIGIKSLEVTRFVPYISIESLTASAILISFLYSWQLAVVFSIIFGTYGYIKISRFNLISITQIMLMCLSSVVSSLLASLDKPFFISYILIFLGKSILSYPIMELVNPNPAKNLTHALGDGFFNMFITVHFMNLIYTLLNFFNLH
ncbi:hypothetical protein JXB41_06700 [Candidatus Woesearchaeota archaeon]|nr:hypothetical protein [Candidatus Woesearchaeota archaeon]